MSTLWAKNRYISEDIRFLHQTTVVDDYLQPTQRVVIYPTWSFLSDGSQYNQMSKKKFSPWFIVKHTVGKKEIIIKNTCYRVYYDIWCDVADNNSDNKFLSNTIMI